MKNLIHYLFNRSKIVISKKGEYAVADFYDCFIFIWQKALSRRELNRYDHFLKHDIDEWVRQNPKTKVIDKRFEPHTYLGN